MSRDAFMRSFAFRWCTALVLHELLLLALARSSAVAALFSPGTHSPAASLALAAGFVSLRVYVVLLWPAALASGMRQVCGQLRSKGPHAASVRRAPATETWTVGPTEP